MQKTQSFVKKITDTISNDFVFIESTIFQIIFKKINILIKVYFNKKNLHISKTFIGI